MLERREEKISYGVLDSACWAKTGVPSIAEEINNELYKAKLPTFGKSSKGRVEGANAFKQRLIGNKNSKGEYVPAIKFFTTCLHTARTIPMLAHDKHNPETFDTDAEDHAVDAICYACLSRPFAPVKATPKRRDAWREETIPSAWAI